MICHCLGLGLQIHYSGHQIPCQRNRGSRLGDGLHVRAMGLRLRAGLPSTDFVLWGLLCILEAFTPIWIHFFLNRDNNNTSLHSISVWVRRDNAHGQSVNTGDHVIVIGMVAGGSIFILLPKYLPGCLPSHSAVSEWHGVDQCHCHHYKTFPVYKEFG